MSSRLMLIFQYWLVATILLVSQQGHAKDSCPELAGVESLAPADRDFLAALCTMNERRAKLWREAHPDEEARLRTILRSLVETEWADAAAVVALLPENAFKPRAAQIGWGQQTLRAAIEKSYYNESGNDDRRKENPEKREAKPLRLPPGEVQLRNGDSFCVEGTGPETKDPYAGGRQAWTILAQKGAEVRLVSGGRNGVMEIVREARLADHAQKTPGLQEAEPADDKCSSSQAKGPEGLVAYTTKLPYGVPYVAWIRQKEPPNNNILGDPPDPAFVIHGVVGDTGDVRIGLPQMAVCTDIQVASESDLLFMLDGVELVVPNRADPESKTRRYARTVWIPEDPNQKIREHRLVVLEGQGDSYLPRASQIVRGAEDGGTCEKVRFDLTREKMDRTVGLGDVEVGDCAAAGIDKHKVRAAVLAFMRSAHIDVADISEDTEANRVIASLGESTQRLGASTDRDWRKSNTAERPYGVGADRATLDTQGLMIRRSEELLRQGFSSYLAVQVGCTKGDAGWDYSLQARKIDLKKIVNRGADPLLGTDLTGVVAPEFEFVLSRADLGVRIRALLARLFGTPAVGLHAMDHKIPFVEKMTGKVLINVPPEHPDRAYYVDLSYLALSEEQSVTQCANVDEFHELRAKSFKPPDPEAGWISGPLSGAHPSSGEETQLLSLQQVRPTRAIVRARLLETTASIPKEGLGRNAFARNYPMELVDQSFRCVDFTNSPVEAWFRVGGWLDLPRNNERNEMMAGVVVGAGFDWRQDIDWLKFGFGLEYAYTERNGNTLPIWDGLDNPDAEFDPAGLFPYVIREHAIVGFVSATGSITFCELGGIFRTIALCGQAGRRVALDAQLALLPGVHIADLSDPALASVPTFRGDQTQILGDVGALIGFGVEVNLAKNVRFEARYSFGWKRLGDYFRPPDAASTYREMMAAPTAGVSWAF